MTVVSVVTIPAALGQNDVPIVCDDAHHATSIVRTWSSRSSKVVTAAGFANPAHTTFIYPPVTAQDGFYGLPATRSTPKVPSSPNCITGVLNWHHGQYTLNTNGSITLTPFEDGFQQVQDPCAAETNFIEGYNWTELYRSWRIFYDPNDGYKLHLSERDGKPVAPLFQVYCTPNMLPTQQLRNVTVTVTSKPQSLFAANSGPRRWTAEGVTGLVTGVFAVGVASLLL
ncbi:chaperone for protein-folding within the ER, fungal-domain-containing protein [Earliella scabrosa]|nr:chaperone for protein-folding within the ER, fungal-domain-containing protein [Earliella scabrosa]